MIATNFKLLRSKTAIDNPVLAAATFDTLPSGKVDISQDATVLKLMA